MINISSNSLFLINALYKYHRNVIPNKRDIHRLPAISVPYE